MAFVGQYDKFKKKKKNTQYITTMLPSNRLSHSALSSGNAVKQCYIRHTEM